jgi:hypothetical protein
MSLFEADLEYIFRIPLDTITTIQLCQSPRGHPEVNIAPHMADILKPL